MGRIKQNQKHIIIISILSLMTFFLAIIVYAQCVRYADYNINLGNVEKSVKLKENDTISQTYSLESGKLIGFAFILSTENNGEKEISSSYIVKGKLYDETTQTLIGEQELELSGQMNYSYMQFEFDDAYKVNVGDIVRAEMKVQKLSDNDGLYINLLEQQNFESARVNNQAVDGTFKVVYQMTRMDYYSLAAMFVIIISGILVIAVYSLIFIYKKTPIEYLYIIIAVVVGTIYFILIPLGQAPDEYTHIETAYDVANVVLGYEHGTDIEMRNCDLEDTIITNDYRREIYDIYMDRLLHDHNISDTGSGMFGDTPLSTNRYLYYPAALGMIIGRLLKLGTIPMMFIGAVFNYIVYVIVAFYSIKKIPFGKTMILLFSILPITMQQVTSYSYDSGILTLSVLIFAMAIRVAYAENLQKRDFIILAIASILIAPVKNGAYFFIILLNLLPLARFRKTNKKRFRLILGIMGISTLMLIFPIVRNMINSANGGTLMNGYVSWADEPGYTVSYLLGNPTALVQICWNTLINNFSYYIYTMIGGSLGWLNIDIPWWIIIALIACLFITAMKKENEAFDLKPWIRCLFAIIALYSIACTAAAMLLDWTPISYKEILGIQGRYFLPVLMPLLYVMRGNWVKINENAEKYCIITTMIMQPFLYYCILSHMLY